MARKVKGKIKRKAVCESCGFKTKLRQYMDGYSKDGPINPKFLCRLCAQTAFGHRDLVQPIQRTINYCTNAILAKLDDVRFHQDNPLFGKIRFPEEKPRGS